MTTLIKNGMLIDPANRIYSQLNVLVQDGKVAEVTRNAPPADTVIDASGKIVAPGFIDIHMHEGAYNQSGKRDDSIFNALLSMGVTTAIGGNCGNNVMSPSEYLNRADAEGVPVNLGLFVGHTDIRSAVGSQNKYQPVTNETLAAMKEVLQKELEGGCLGISFGTKYVPGTTYEELLAVASLCKAKNKPIASHIREDAAGVYDAVEEIASIGQELHIPVQISHIGSMGAYGQMEKVLAMVDAYSAAGLNISCDCYPYYAFSTEIGETTYDDGWLERYQTDYSSIELCEGKYKGMRCTKEIFEKLRREAPGTITVCHVMKPAEVDMALLHPNVMLATDGFMHNGQGHPRAAGTFPRFLSRYVNTGKISLYDAIYKMSAQPAQKLGLPCKGRLQVGADADIVIFDPVAARDTATFSTPASVPVGIDTVLVNGMVAVSEGKLIHTSAGRAVRA